MMNIFNVDCVQAESGTDGVDGIDGIDGIQGVISKQFVKNNIVILVIDQWKRYGRILKRYCKM